MKLMITKRNKIDGEYTYGPVKFANKRDFFNKSVQYQILSGIVGLFVGALLVMFL